MYLLLAHPLGRHRLLAPTEAILCIVAEPTACLDMRRLRGHPYASDRRAVCADDRVSDLLRGLLARWSGRGHSGWSGRGCSGGLGRSCGLGGLARNATTLLYFGL